MSVLFVCVLWAEDAGKCCISHGLSFSRTILINFDSILYAFGCMYLHKLHAGVWFAYHARADAFRFAN